MKCYYSINNLSNFDEDACDSVTRASEHLSLPLSHIYNVISPFYNL